MKLGELVQRSNVIVDEVQGEAIVLRPIADTREVRPDDLFFCQPSARRDTHALIPEAMERGATAAVLHGRRGVEHATGPYILPTGGEAGYQEAAWRLAHCLLDFPSRTMKVVGVTGTNGKTTTAWLLRDLLQACGLDSSYLGTLGFRSPSGDRQLENTTPPAVELANLLADARSQGTQALAMEVSSHALAERRADGVEFDAAVFTNLTQDHLDFHDSMETYAEAKWRLFADLPTQTGKPFVAAMNVDDPLGAEWAARIASPVVRYSLRKGEDWLSGTVTDIGLASLTIALSWKGQSVGPVRVPIGGSFNADNTLAAAAGMVALGFDLDRIGDALPAIRPVPGRFEAVPNDRGIGVIVDYAHTPDALQKLLDAVCSLAPRRLITVFGCGGDRDRSKRPIMARLVSQRSDLTVVTSDNPRTEDAAAILAEVAAGIAPGQRSIAILDRREAVAYAIGQAMPRDVVVIAGKGHENYQIVGTTKLHMDDRELARAALGVPA